jgi:hypothetical protein
MNALASISTDGTTFREQRNVAGIAPIDLVATGIEGLSLFYSFCSFISSASLSDRLSRDGLSWDGLSWTDSHELSLAMPARIFNFGDEPERKQTADSPERV